MFVLLAFFITFLININENKGVMPAIFLLLAGYSVITFSYYILYTPVSYDKWQKNNNFRVGYLIFFLINIFMYALSYIVLWR